MSTNPAVSALTHGHNASIEKMPPEIFRLIANELGEREENNGRYRSFGDLTRFILAVKPGKAVLEEYLYTEDILCKACRGFLIVFSRNDELAVAVLSKYPVALVKPHINKQFNATVNGQAASWTMLHMAAADCLEKTIVKLHELGALYQDTKSFAPMLDDKSHKALARHTRISHHPYFGHMQCLRWKPGFVPFILDNERICTLLARLWDTSTVATWHFKYVIVNKPADYPMTMQHLAVLVSDDVSMKWTLWAAQAYPGWVEAPCGETRSSLLHVALKAKNKKVLEFLLQRGIGFGPHFVDTDGNNPMHILIMEGLKATTAKNRAEWRELKDIFFNTVPQLEWNIMMVQTRHPRNSPLQLAIEHIRHNWGASKTAIKEIINLVLEKEMMLLNKWNFPPTSLLINLPNADGNTPLSELAFIIDNREQSYSEAHWRLFDRLIRHGANINLDVNAIFTPKSYQHSISNLVHRRGRFLGHITDSHGKEHDAELEETYPVSTPTNMETYKFHAHQLPPGNPLNLPMPFSWPLLPLPPMVKGVANVIMQRERMVNCAITGDPDISPYFVHIPYAQSIIAAAAAAAASAVEAAQNEQDETRV